MKSESQSPPDNLINIIKIQLNNSDKNLIKNTSSQKIETTLAMSGSGSVVNLKQQRGERTIGQDSSLGSN